MAGEAAAALAPMLGRAEAHQLVEDAASEARRSATPLRNIMLAAPALPHRARQAVDKALDIGPSIDAAAAVVAPVVAEARAVRARLRNRGRKG